MGLKKFLSRKLLVVCATAVLDILIMAGVIPSEVKELALTLVNSLAGVYVVVQGIIDAIQSKKVE